MSFYYNGLLRPLDLQLMVQGLFFRTPQENQVLRYSPTVGRAMTFHTDTKPHGLGFDFDDDPDRRQSASDDSTVEVTTPVTMRAVKGPYLGYESEGVTVIPASVDELASPPPISGAFLPTGSTDTSPASQQSGTGQSDDSELSPLCILCIRSDIYRLYSRTRAYPPGGESWNATRLGCNRH